MMEIIDYTNKSESGFKYDLMWLYNRTPYAYLLGEIGKFNQTEEMLIKTLEFDKDPSGIMKYFSVKLLTPEICLLGIKQSPANYQYIPDKFKTNEICRLAKEGEAKQALCISGEAPKDNASSNSEHVLVSAKIKKAKLPTSEENALAIRDSGFIEVRRFKYVTNEEPFYIFDIHLEHQFDLTGKTQYEIERLLKKNLDNIHYKDLFYLQSPLIIGGDVASSKPLVSLFYKVIREYWRGPVVGVMGNHELWDCIDDTGKVKSVDQITEEYRDILELNGCILLEKDLLLCKSANEWVRLDEKNILNKSDEELSKIIAESYYVMLGGLGFSGYAPKYNAESGMYSLAITSVHKDKEQSDRFRAIYEKVIRCSGNKQVVVITHTPIHNWGLAKTASECIYLNGHTHRNSIMKANNGAVVFANNQVGYRPRKWDINLLKSFCLRVNSYNPFGSLPSGIYKVEKRDYIVANSSLGISIDGFKRKGDVILLKNMGTSMFLFRAGNSKGEKKLYLLEGGKTYNTDKSIEYYYENIPIYASIVKKAYAPYYEALCQISEEIKAFGGSGRIHGCIVDIDFLNHVYLNPIDGQVSFYYAEDMYSRVAMPLEQMLEGTGHLEAYQKQQKKGSITVINSSTNKQPVVPEIMFGTEMYEPSKALLKLQYLIEDDIIRVWKDEVLRLGNKRLPESKDNFGLNT